MGRTEDLTIADAMGGQRGNTATEVIGDPTLVDGGSAQASVAAVPPGLFRPNVVQARGEEVPIEPLPDLTASRWLLLGFVTVAVFALLGFGYFGRVEVTSIASGVLLVQGGPRPVLAQASGQVAELAVKAGDVVKTGQQLARLDATELRARKRRTEEQLDLLRDEDLRVSGANAALYRSTVSTLQRKRTILAERSVLKRAVAADRLTRANNMETLAREGAGSQMDALAAREAWRSAQEELLVLRQQIAEIDLELNDRKRSFRTEQNGRQRQLKEAESGLSEASTVIDLAAIRAPVAGRVESLLVTEGQVVPVGTTLARIVPDGALRSVVVFAPVKDASFLVQGLQANVEFASLPVSEFGKAVGVVTRVSGDVASRDEVAAILGVAPPEPLIRVEVELQPGPVLDKVNERLRSGERLLARINTRKQRIITLFFAFLRRWYVT